LKKRILRAVSETDAFTDGGFPGEIGFGERPADHHDVRRALHVPGAKEAAVRERNFQGRKIARTDGDDLAFVFLPSGGGAAFDNESDGAAAATSGNS